MSRPVYATFLANIKGPPGEKGDTGTFESATAESVAADQPAEAIISGPNGEDVHFKVPRGLPGVNAVANDAATAGYIAATDSDTRAALAVAVDEDAAVAVADAGSATRAATDALYPVRLLWDTGTETYPARVAGAVNFFLGPEDPGVDMDPDFDYWANPEGTTIDEVVTEVQNPASDLYAAVQTAARPEIVEFGATDFAPVDNRPATMGTLSPAANMSVGVPVLLYGDTAVTVAGRTWRTPVGWSACRVYVDWGHSIASPSGSVNWQVRIADYTDALDLSTTPGLQTLAQLSAVPVQKTTKRMLIAGNFTLNPAGAEVRLAVARLSTTIGGTAGLIKIILERTA